MERSGIRRNCEIFFGNGHLMNVLITQESASRSCSSRSEDV